MIQSTRRLFVFDRFEPLKGISLALDGTWLVKASVRPSVASDIVLWKYIVPKSAIQRGRPRKLMTATVVVSVNLMTRKVAMETVTQVVGNTHLGQRYDCCGIH